MVKMRCIETRHYGDLTYGHVYEGTLSESNWFQFTDDAGDGRGLPSDMFQLVEEAPGMTKLRFIGCSTGSFVHMTHGKTYEGLIEQKKGEFTFSDDVEDTRSLLLRYFVEPDPGQPANPLIRMFESGATRNLDHNKIDYEGFLSPTALHAFGEYMHGKRVQADGTVRDSDNWRKGIPLPSYMKSMWRHMMDVWQLHHGMAPIQPETGAPVDMEEALCALFFNVQGYLHEYLKTTAND